MFSDKIKSDPLSDNWDKVWLGSNYSNHSLRIQRSTIKIDILISHGVKFLKGLKVLDAGCGDGTTLLLLKNKFDIDAFGVDISKNALKKAAGYAKEVGENIQLIEADTRVIPYSANFFDLILSWGVIEHFNNYEMAISEFSRLLKQRGTLNLIQPNKLSLGGLQRKYLELIGKWESGSQIEFSSAFLNKILIRNGFENIRYFAVPASSDMKFVYYTDLIISKLIKGWGHYLYVLADKRYDSSVQRTMVLIKPDAFENGLVNSILTRIESMPGVTILEREKFIATKKKVELHHSEHLFKSLGASFLRESLVKYWLSGLMLKVLIEGRDVIDRVHDLVGTTDPAKSPTNTIRAMSKDSLDMADQENRAVRNLIHAPRSSIEAARDIGIWFNG